MPLTKEEFQKVVAGTSDSNFEKYYQPLVDAMDEFGIDTKERQVMFLAHIMVESGGMRYVAENLNYSADRLRQVFGKYYRTDSEASLHAGRPVKIASRVYANRMGNGTEASQDGWNFRGRGLKQLTGKYNYTNCGNDLGYDLVNDPSYLETPAGASRSAAWFWHSNNLNKYADARDIKGSTKAINGGYNGLEDRTKYYNRGMDIIASSNDGTDQPEKLPLLKQGSKGAAVERLQGLLSITVDGKFGPGTKKAVQAFQKENGLIADGEVGTMTWKVLLNA